MKRYKTLKTVKVSPVELATVSFQDRELVDRSGTGIEDLGVSEFHI